LTGRGAGFRLTIVMNGVAAHPSEGSIMRRISSMLIVGVSLGSAVSKEASRAAPAGQDLPGPFRAYVVTGDLPKASPEGLLPLERQNLGDYGRVGKYHDFVTQYGLDPCVAVFARGQAPAADQPLGKLLQSLDQAVAQNKAARLHAWAVFLGIKDDILKDETRSAQIKQIEAFAQAAQLKQVPLALDLTNSDRTRAYAIAPETLVTVILYANLKIVARWDLTAEKPLDEAALLTISAEITKIVAPKK